MGALIRVENLIKTFPVKNSKKVLWAINGISFNVEPGETLGLVGESGSGKTTVGRCILRIIEPQDGHIYLDSHDITGIKPGKFMLLRRRMQMVFQDPYSSLNPRKTVGQIIEGPLKSFGLGSSQERRSKVMEIMSKMGLSPSTYKSYPNHLTAAEQQLVGIARAIAPNPDFIVLDEPTSTLDPLVRANIIDLLMTLQKDLSISYLFISHDLTTVRHISNRVAVMYLGKIVEIGQTEDIFAYPMHPYTRSLLSSVLFPDPARRSSVIVLKGEIPSPVDLPKGCSLYSRCPEAGSICSEKQPDLKIVEGKHFVACHKI
jgi:oligopeptide/dipeptide ABC transporter ATP-binding protein